MFPPAASALIRAAKTNAPTMATQPKTEEETSVSESVSQPERKPVTRLTIIVTTCITAAVGGCASSRSRMAATPPTPTPAAMEPLSPQGADAHDAGSAAAAPAPALARQEVARTEHREAAPAPTSEIQPASHVTTHVTSRVALGVMQGVAGVAGFSPQVPPVAPEPLPDDMPESSGVTLADLEELAMSNNPSLRAASAAASEAAGVRTQVGLPPNPTVGYFGEEIGNEGSGGLQGAYVSQTIVTGDKLRLNQDVLNEDVRRLTWEVETQRYRVRTDVRQRFYDALSAQRRLELALEFQEVAEKGVEIARQRFDALEGARPDILQSEIQLNEVELIARQARLDFDGAWRELTAVIGSPEMEPVRLEGTLPAEASPREMESAYQQLLSASPELQSAYARVQRARANMRRQDVQPIPNVLAQIGFGHDNGTGDEFANFQLGVPLPIHNRNQGNASAAYAEYSRATHDVQRVRMSLRSRLARALRDYSLALATVERYREEILPRAEENLRLSEEAYVAGEFDFLRVLVSRREFFDANLNYVNAQAELAKSNAVFDGLMLSGGLTATPDIQPQSGLRGQALSGQ